MADTKGPWDVKYLRETPFIAFGSMMNAYGRINEGKGITQEELKKVADDLYSKAKALAEDAYGSAAQEDTMDIPIKKEPLIEKK